MISEVWKVQSVDFRSLKKQYFWMEGQNQQEDGCIIKLKIIFLFKSPSSHS